MQEKTGIYTDEEYLNFKMNIFRPLDQEFFKNIIVDAIEVAQEEARIEEELTAIRLRWEEREFLICFMICTKRWLMIDFYLFREIHSIKRKYYKNGLRAQADNYQSNQ